MHIVVYLVLATSQVNGGLNIRNKEKMRTEYLSDFVPSHILQNLSALVTESYSTWIVEYGVCHHRFCYCQPLRREFLKNL